MMMQFPAQEPALKDKVEHQEVTPELIAMAFEVILEGYVRLEQKSLSHFHFKPGQLEAIQQEKADLVDHYFHLAKARKMDQLAAFRFMRYDLREKLS